MTVPALIEAWRKWNRSVAVAYEGIVNTIRAERNMRIHMAAAIVVLALALVLRLPIGSLLWVLLATALVIAAELFNTAVERAVDLTSPSTHPLAKAAKDAAAGAVLVLSLFAIGVGAAVLYAPVRDIVLHGAAGLPPMGIGERTLASAAWIASVMLAIQAWTRRGGRTGFDAISGLLAGGALQLLRFGADSAFVWIVWIPLAASALSVRSCLPVRRGGTALGVCAGLPIGALANWFPEWL